MNKVALTRKMIEEAPSTKAMLELEPIRNAWMRTYADTTGRQDGDLRYNAEKILFLQTIEGSTALQKADKFSVFGAFIELALSGLTLRDGICYVVPYGKKAQFMVGWKGRLEQVYEMKEVKFCHEPQVVYEDDDFEYERGERVKIIRHKPPKVRAQGAKITHVYWVIEFTHGSVVYVMEAQDVYNIRDNYSSSWQQYLKDVKKAGKQIGERWTESRQGQYGPYEVEVEGGMWLTDEAQAFKKTIVHRVWKTLPKLPRHKFLDDELARRGVPATAEPEEVKDFATYTNVVDEQTGEVLSVKDLEERQQEQQQEQPKAEVKTPPAAPAPTINTQHIQDAEVIDDSSGF